MQEPCSPKTATAGAAAAGKGVGGGAGAGGGVVLAQSLGGGFDYRRLDQGRGGEGRGEEGRSSVPFLALMLSVAFLSQFGPVLAQ